MRVAFTVAGLRRNHTVFPIIRPVGRHRNNVDSMWVLKTVVSSGVCDPSRATLNGELERPPVWAAFTFSVIETLH